nr:hypothetical protein [Yersinia phage Rostov 43]
MLTLYLYFVFVAAVFSFLQFRFAVVEDCIELVFFGFGDLFQTVFSRDFFRCRCAECGLNCDNRCNYFVFGVLRFRRGFFFLRSRFFSAFGISFCFFDFSATCNYATSGQRFQQRVSFFLCCQNLF